MEFVQLAEYGVCGVAVAAIAALGYVIKRFMDFMQEHMGAHTKATTELLVWLKTKNGG